MFDTSVQLNSLMWVMPALLCVCAQESVPDYKKNVPLKSLSK